MTPGTIFPGRIDPATAKYVKNESSKPTEMEEGMRELTRGLISILWASAGERWLVDAVQFDSVHL